MTLVDKFLRFQSSLTKLNSQEDFLKLSIDFKVRKLLESCCYLLNASRVSLWVFSEDRSRIICQSLYNRSNKSFETGAVIAQYNCPNYFNVLKDNRIISVRDAQKDARTNEFSVSYLKPLDIKSILDAPLFSHGQLSGVLCIEQTSACREWDMAEISYVASTADAISMFYAQDKWLTERQELLFMEQIDPLTNLENRLFFQKRINRAIKNSTCNHHCGIVLIGLDGFTGINDRFGHEFANSVLCAVARHLEKITRSVTTYISRIGGDVFGLWLPNLDSDNKSTLAGKKKLDALISLLERAFPLKITSPTNEVIQVYAGIGYVVNRLEKMLDFDPIRKAEIAMLEAKKTQPRTICYYDLNWDKTLQEAIKLEDELVTALKTKQIKPYYQPILGENYLRDGFSLEALVRWEHPEKGIIPPFVFLPIAKRLGLMKEIGDLVLEQACHDIHYFNEQGVNLQRISINISSEQLFSSTLVKQLEETVDKYQIAFSSLELEIIEELIAGDSKMLMKQLDAITSLGIKLSIDDFGTGYSSLSRLKNLNVSKLKIDKSFVDGLPNNEEDICIAKSIIGLAKGMGLELVAEGVETKEQAKWLLKNGCELLQGYLFSKPVKAGLIVDFLKQASNFPPNDQPKYDISIKGNIIEVSATGNWDGNITQNFFNDINKTLDKEKLLNWAFLIDTTKMAVGSIRFQHIIKSDINSLLKRNLQATAFIIPEDDIVISQLKLLHTENMHYKRRFFEKKQYALTWLAKSNFLM